MKQDTDLMEVRKKISAVDAKIVSLLNERVELAREVRKFKPRILDTLREKQVIEHVLSLASPKLEKKFVLKLFEDIMAECRRIQANESPGK